MKPPSESRLRGAAASWLAGASFLEERRARLVEHPAVRAWRALGRERLEPVRVLPGRKSPESMQRSPLYRLEGVGDGGRPVIAKWCSVEGGRVERIIYKEVLPEVPVEAPRYYGSVDDAGSGGFWLFLEHVEGEKYSRLVPLHRALAARWLALLHTSAVGATARARLPDGGPARHLANLRGARDGILGHRANLALGADEVGFLELLVARLDELEAIWGRLEEACKGLPPALVHGDFKGSNLRIRSGRDGPTLVAFDWGESAFGVPAVDLAQSSLPASALCAIPDLEIYESVVRSRNAQAERRTIERVAQCGTIFRAVAAIRWAACRLESEWPASAVQNMRFFDADLANALRAAGWARP
jgi:aminoglycoside phosphotransferase (APT) family kinase protein